MPDRELPRELPAALPLVRLAEDLRALEAPRPPEPLEEPRAAEEARVEREDREREELDPEPADAPLDRGSLPRDVVPLRCVAVAIS